ncbi:MAG: hypothetical protein HYW69_01615 [Candidatus Nealsonbacteria bacterium]|nr:hypothetical protein [Candidatus Nealsonbacteria bacterium]
MKNQKISRKKLILLISIVSLLIIGLVISIIWLKSRKTESTTEVLQKEYEISFVTNVLPHVKNIISLEEFDNLVLENKVMEAYRQFRKEESVTIIYYFINIKDQPKDEYYLSYVPSNHSFIVPVGLSMIYFDPATYLIQNNKAPVWTIPTSPMQPQRDWLTSVFIPIFVVIILVGGLIFLLFYGFGRNKFTKVQLQEAKKPVYFPDAGGVDEAIEESREVAEIIRAKWQAGGEK